MSIMTCWVVPSRYVRMSQPYLPPPPSRGRIVLAFVGVLVIRDQSNKMEARAMMCMPVSSSFLSKAEGKRQEKKSPAALRAASLVCSNRGEFCW